MSQNDYVAPSDLQNVSEAVTEVESEDYLTYDLMPVGDYVSKTRTIKVAQKEKDGISYISAEVSFPEGVENENGESLGGGNYPLRTWITTKQFAQQNRPGTTSTVANYLRAIGFDVKTLRTTQEILDALAESQTMPIKVFISWTNKTEKISDGVYTKEFAKLKDFNQGTKDEPKYVPTFELNGAVVQAKHKVGGFRQVA